MPGIKRAELFDAVLIKQISYRGGHTHATLLRENRSDLLKGNRRQGSGFFRLVDDLKFLIRGQGVVEIQQALVQTADLVNDRLELDCLVHALTLL